jgi:hypothetical protein
MPKEPGEPREKNKDELSGLLEQGGYSESESFEDGEEGRKKMQEYLSILDGQNKVYQTLVSKSGKVMVWRVFERDKREGED